MAKTLLNTSYNVGAYNTSGSYVDNAYTFRCEVIENSVTNLVHNITVNWYIKGNNGFYYSGFSGINTVISTKNTSLNETTYTERAKSTYNSMSSSGSEYKMLSATFNLNSNATTGALKFVVKLFYDGGESANFLPRLHTKEFNCTGTTVSVVPTVKIGISGSAKKVKSIYVGVNGVAKKVKTIYVGVNGIAKKVK